MIEASDIFNQLATDISWMSKWQYIYQKSLGKLPYWSSLQSDIIQQQEQAELNFINSVLRKESWAAIAPSEYTSAQKQYFPQPWDSEKVLENKRQNRVTAVKGMAASSWQNKVLSQAINQVTTTTPKTATEKTQSKTYTQTATGPNWVRMWTTDWKNWEVIK
jgi:hypothetical protein